MAQTLQKSLLSFGRNLQILVRYKSQRRSLGKPPGEARSLDQRLEELYFKDPKVHYKINIGFAPRKVNTREISFQRGMHLKQNRKNLELEKLSRSNQLQIPLQDVEEVWSETNAPFHIKAIAEHYSVYEHLFGDAYFYPVVSLNIDYVHGSKLISSYWGNTLKPEETKDAPNVQFTSKPDSLWTLVMVTPDCNFSSKNLEYCHWFVGNIKGNDIKSGETKIQYAQPLPLQGLGYLRYIFILYKQEEILDYSGVERDLKKNSLEERNFSTYHFYKERQQKLTPAGLSFFTADWDQSVTEYYNKLFALDCPKYVYDFPKHFYKKQKWFPLREAFNLYLDRYRDEKEIAKEYLIEKLKTTDPFKERAKPLLFPNAIPFKPDTPSWLKTEFKKKRLRFARARDYL